MRNWFFLSSMTQFLNILQYIIWSSSRTSTSSSTSGQDTQQRNYYNRVLKEMIEHRCSPPNQNYLLNNFSGVTMANALSGIVSKERSVFHTFASPEIVIPSRLSGCPTVSPTSCKCVTSMVSEAGSSLGSIVLKGIAWPVKAPLLKFRCQPELKSVIIISMVKASSHALGPSIRITIVSISCSILRAIKAPGDTTLLLAGIGCISSLAPVRKKLRQVAFSAA